ncbi:MAG TPA: hypothetical protein VFR97_08410 [Capillimicrobium sp.]|nr:hypothetical protein [Capillimicrobium sp.]
MREEGLSASELGRGIVEHAEHRGQGGDRFDRWLSIGEAVLLSIVALVAGWSGYAAAKWATESSLLLAEEAAARTDGSRAHLHAVDLRNFDASTFNAWYAAYTVRNRQAMALAERRFRPAFRVAFEAWRATRPETNPDAPKGPTYMPQYRQPGLREARALDAKADDAREAGEAAGRHSDDYVRTTVFLAIVLFLVGISTHFPLRGGRLVLIGLGTGLLVLSLVLIAGLPGPPG